MFGFVVSIVLYVALSYFFPAKEALVKETVWDLDQIAIEAFPRQSGSIETGSDAGRFSDKAVDADSK
ncbi:hypothetical protein NPX13_g6103 [Xylaria arbuscula]|uniref:Uncharacterized protein n=1 Tax=Xylaria arbuscula TaxID=114810 RepID=A0A9W8NDA0_9PEZI|nr:hypothetical protein NPX13_g6103 [Xylaria arbuscula]